MRELRDGFSDEFRNSSGGSRFPLADHVGAKTQGVSDDSRFLTVDQRPDEDVLIGGVEFAESSANEVVALGFFQLVRYGAGKRLVFDGLFSQRLTAQVGLNDIAGNAVNERRQFHGIAEVSIPQRAQDVDQYVVQEIARDVTIACARTQHCIDSWAEETDEFAFGIAIALENALRQFRLALFR